MIKAFLVRTSPQGSSDGFGNVTPLIGCHVNISYERHLQSSCQKCIKCYGTHCNEKDRLLFNNVLWQRISPCARRNGNSICILKRQGQHLWYHFTDHWHKVEEMNVTRRKKTEECSAAIQAACTSGKLYLDLASNMQ